jgi:hypothetical protein
MKFDVIVNETGSVKLCPELLSFREKLPCFA